ncbi:arrestin domain-containing protein 3-like [Cololabis saira]|uniref:arrestin domain-containing protein 3-like n=1 Tax=Cololabis saira TaxID=129043 RepID=UPI002AD51C91|nr:arrestin domain-containing protein 3-like [Cololabis saira]
MTIKTFQIEYDAINDKNTFTNGDTINGRIILEVSKETRIESLVFMAEGKANVCWHEQHGQHHHHVYWSNEKYYSIKDHILRESRQDGTEVIGKGRHVFPFSFNIPDRKMPSTFKTSIGKIVHKIKAELKQSMKLTKKTKVHFTFISNADMDTPGLMEPQHNSKDKSLAFGSGNVSMDIYTKRMGYRQGENLHVTVEINNRSSRSAKAKFVFYEKKSYFAQGRRRVHTQNIVKGKIDAADSASGKSAATEVIPIPGHLPSSILNCSIIKLEYRLKIYLDIKCASDPVVKLPIVILPEAAAGTQQAALPAFGFEAYGMLSQPAWSSTPDTKDPPPPYGACAMSPSSPYDKYNSSHKY